MLSIRKKPLASISLQSFLCSTEQSPSVFLSAAGKSVDLPWQYADQLSPRTKKGLLSPVPRRVVRRKPQYQRPQLRTQRLTQSSAVSPRNLQKGFRLLKSLFGIAEVPLQKPTFSQQAEAVVELKPISSKISYQTVNVVRRKSAIVEASAVKARGETQRDGSLSQLIELDLRLGRRRSLVQPKPSQIDLQDISPMQEPAAVPIITPVLRLRAVADSDLSESSGDDIEEVFERVQAQRRMSVVSKHPLSRRPTELLPDSPKAPRRASALFEELKRTQSGRDMVSDYKMKTAEILSETQFRLKALKSQFHTSKRY